MLNKIILMGRLTREPELRYTPQNVPVCTITLAVDRDFTRAGEQRETDFIDVVAWRNTAEFVSKWFRKGLLVAVDGRLQGRKWKDKHEQNRVTLEIVADSVYFAERTDSQPHPANTQSGDYGAPPPGYMPQNNPAPARQYQQPAAQQSYQQTFGNLDVDADDDDDVPF